MKKFRVLLSVVAVVVALFSITVVASAESAIKFAETEIAYTDGENVIVEVKSNTDEVIAGGGYFNLAYDKTAWKYEGFSVEGLSADLASLEQYIDTDYISFTLHPINDVDLAVDQTIAYVEFSVVEKANIGANDFWFVDDECFTDTGYNGLAYSGSLSVKAAAPAKTPAAVEAGTAAFQTITGASGQVYNNVWVNKYTAKANDDTITAVKLAFNGKTVTVSDVEIEAGGTVEFDVAIVGAALEAEVTPSVTVK